MRKCICAVAAEYELPYLQEWVDWHVSLGFDITVHCNNWTDSPIPQSNGNVRYLREDGVSIQVPTYNKFLHNNKTQYDWIGFLDIDEFLVLKGYQNVDEMFSLNSNRPALAISWKLFGSNGHLKLDGDTSVIRRFTRSQEGVDKHVKTFVNCSFCKDAFIRFTCDPHHTNAVGFSPEGSQVFGPFNRNGSDKLAYIAHFLTKSRQECIDRRSKPRADCGVPRANLEEFFTAHDCNSVLNLDLIGCQGVQTSS